MFDILFYIYLFINILCKEISIFFRGANIGKSLCPLRL